jgi:hypothetical protein
MSWREVQTLTGVDLSDVEAFGFRAGEFVAQNLPAVEGVASGIQAVVAAATTLAPVQSAAALGAQVAKTATLLYSLEAALAADARASSIVNQQRLARRRDEFIFATYRDAWLTQREVIGPRDPVMVRPALNKGLTEAQVTANFVGQYEPPVVFALARGAGRRDVLWPIYPTDTSGLGLPLPDPRWRFWMFEERTAFLDLPPLGGSSGTTGLCVQELTCERGDLPMGWMRYGCLPIDISTGCVPWRRSWALYSLGTWPCWGALGQRWPLGPGGLALTALIHSPSSAHTRVRADDVRARLRALVSRTHVGELRSDPGQGESGVFRRGVRLVLRGQGAQSWSPANRLMPGERPPPLVAGVDLAVMIDRCCAFLAVRQALLLALQTGLALPPEVRAAAAASPDPELKDAAAKKWSGRPFHPDDPLGLFRQPVKRRGRDPVENSQPTEETKQNPAKMKVAAPAYDPPSSWPAWVAGGALGTAAAVVWRRRTR